MILYHGSYLKIQTPNLLYSRENVDFGRGFYTTPLYDQAVKWCEKFKRRGKNMAPILRFKLRIYYIPEKMLILDVAFIQHHFTIRQ